MRTLLAGILLATFCSHPCFSIEAKASTYLETVIVSAQRSPTALTELPLSATQITAEVLARILARHPSQLFQQSPGTWISRGSGQEHLSAIRSPVFTGAGACANFLMAEDGIPLRASGFCNVNQLFDSHYEAADNIELVRGPNSALHGSNALFGAVNIRLPDAQGSDENQLGIDLAPYDDYRVRTSMATTSSDHNRWRILATISSNGGERDSAGYQQAKLSLKNSYVGRRVQLQSGLSISFLDQQTAGYIEGENAYKDPSLSTQNLNPNAYRKARSARAYTHITWKQGHNTFSITPFMRSNDMEFLMHFVPWQPLEKNAHQSIGTQLQWSLPLSSTLKFRLGSDLEYTHASLEEIQPQQAPFAPERFPQGIHYDYSVSAVAGALFAAFDWQASSALSLHASVRNDHIRYDYTNHASTGSACAPGVPNCRFFRVGDRQDHFLALTTSVGGTWAWHQNHRVFANIARGFRAPQASELYRLQQGQDRADLNEVTLDNTEVGLRGDFNRLYYQVSAYQMRMHNGIYQDSERQTLSGAQTQHRGFEYEGGITLNAVLQLQFNGTFADHRYRNNPQLLGTQSPLEGNVIDTAPRTLHSVLLSWQNSARLQTYLEAEHMGAYFLDPENSAHYEGHQLIHVRAQYALSDTFDLQFAIENASNTAYAERADLAFGEYRYFPGQSRTLRASAHWSF